MADQKNLDLDQPRQENVTEYKFEPIKGHPMLNWRGKRPFTSTQFYPAQKKEEYGYQVDGWMNKMFWGDNLQVMSFLLKDFRAKVDLIYIDPPFDSKADYKKKIEIRKLKVESRQTPFEEKQYTDIWNNDEYLQYIYERLILLRELLSDTGSIYVHCDYRKVHHLRILMDEVFGASNFINQLVWRRRTNTIKGASNTYSTNTDYILLYGKTKDYKFTTQYEPYGEGYEDRFKNEDRQGKYRWQVMATYSDERYEKLLSKKQLRHADGAKYPEFKQYLSALKGRPVQDIWTDINMINAMGNERLNYPTQKPESLLNRIIQTSSEKGDIVLDCFMGSGTTMASALKLGRRFIGADINLGAIQTSTKRIINILKSSSTTSEPNSLDGCGFRVYNVNNYDIFRNPVQAKELLIQGLEIQRLEKNSIFDGEKDGRMVKIMPVNRITTKADLNELISGFNYKSWERKQNENPGKPVEKILLVCMGHEPDIKAHLELEAKPFKIDIEVVDILRDKSQLEFKRDSEALISIKNNEIEISKFYPMNLLQKLSLQKEKVGDWRELVESIMIDWNYDGAILQPTVLDIPEKNELVIGKYKIPKDAGTIRVKVTDLLSESWEGNIDG